MMKFFKNSSGIKFWIEKVNGKIWVHFKGRNFILPDKKKEQTVDLCKKSNISKEPYLKSPISGRVFSIKVKEGDNVQEGDSLIVIESMKIEHTLRAFRSAKVKSVLVKEGQPVESNEKLLLFH